LEVEFEILGSSSKKVRNRGINMITVQVVGVTGEGKSTIARVIKLALEERGFEVEFVDVNDGPERTGIW